MTKDHIPIVYHDFYINQNICLDENGNTIDDNKNILLYDYNLNQFRLVKILLCFLHSLLISSCENKRSFCQ